MMHRVGASLVLLAALVASRASAQIKAFPQAEGFGASALGGRGGDVYHVTNLTDSGPGSLRFGLDNAPASGRTVVFDVGGWITLTSKLGLTKNRVTIAGQTAPGGIGIRNGQFSVGSDDVLVRHMRFRPGKITNIDHDSINTNENAQRVIYDHISAEFSTDGGFDLQADLITLQYSSVSFGLLTHSTGGLIQSPTGGAAGELSFHHNMFAHNETRNPKARAELIDWRDNVVYNYHNGFLAGESETDVNPNWRANFDGNTYISNIGGNAGSGGRPMMTGGRTQNYDLWYGMNALDRDADSQADPIVYTRDEADSSQSIVSSQYNWSATPFAAADIWQSGSPAAAYTRVLAEFGATPWARDAVNQLIHTQVQSRTGQRISNENSLGIANAGYPNLNPGNLTAPLDADGDGMPDAWEAKHGLSTNVASNNDDFDSDGFTNLEEYLNDVAAFKAIGPLEFDGTGRYADWANWTRRWEPSRVDDVSIPTGTAIVNAVGQKAGTLRVGSSPGNTGALSVIGGWIEITDNLQMGVGGEGYVSQTGGEVRVLNGTVAILAGSYNLAGGVLAAPAITVGSIGSLELLGGRLETASVSTSIVNRGTTIAPGASPGATRIMGDLTLESGAIEIELGGTGAGQFDRIVVDGALAAGGLLDVRLIDGFAPAAGDQFDLFDFATANGDFTLVLPVLADGLVWDSSKLLSTGVLAVAVPEPATLALLVFGVISLVRTRRIP
jgi:pectate lyase